MKASHLKAGLILFFVVLSIGFILIGYKKETPSSYELTAKEKEFLSAPDAVTSRLKETKISKIDIPKNQASYIIDHMKRHNRRYVKQAQITLANRPFKIILGFFPEQEFYVYDIENKFMFDNSSTSYNLHSYHNIDDELFEFMLIEGDTKIAARPYQGPVGTIKLGKGGRELEKVGFRGSLFMKGGISAPIGTMRQVEQCRIPVGDYTLGMFPCLYVTYDNLYFRISNYSNARRRYSEKDIIYPIQIRRDKPYVLDFSNEPMVIFDQPMVILDHSHRSKTTFSRGDEIRFSTSLTDPKLDISIDSLHDRSVMVDREYKRSDGTVFRTKVTKSLDPIFVIARADGEVIAEDVFSSYGYTSWRVPDDLQINGDGEELTVTVTYDTQKLYGQVSAQRKIKIRK